MASFVASSPRRMLPRTWRMTPWSPSTCARSRPPRPMSPLRRGSHMRWVLVLALVALIGCARGENEVGSVGGRDTLGDGELALPPSGGAPSPRAGGASPDTVSAEDAAPHDTTMPGLTETVGPVPPARLDVGAIVNVYRRNYQELFSEFGSEVRNDVDSKLVEDAKRMTALDHGF